MGPPRVKPAGSLSALVECAKGNYQPIVLSTGLGLPLTNVGGRLLSGTFISKNADNPREKLRNNPNFIRAFAASVLLVKPGKLLHTDGLTFHKFVGGWHKLSSCSTLKGARALAGLAITSPSKVLNIFGRSLCGLARHTPDQLSWLQSSWHITSPWDVIPCGRPRSEQLLEFWRDKAPARLRLASTIGRTFLTSPGSSGQSCEIEKQFRSLDPRGSTR